MQPSMPTMAQSMNPSLQNTIGTPTIVNKFKNIDNIGKNKRNQNSKVNFIDIKNTIETDSDEEDEDEDEEEVTQESGDTEHFASRYNTIEPFIGSTIIESVSMRNILLALLITFLSYIVAFTAMRNLLPITTWFPELKKFKNFIYWGLLFLVVYLCLEMF